MPSITPLPDPPSRADPANFSARADVFLAAMQVFSEQISALAAAIDAGDSAAALAGNLASAASGMGSALIDFSRALTVGGKVSAPRFEATNTDDSDTPDAAYRVNRTLSSASSASGHGFRDQTTFARAAGSSYAAFDGAVTIAGSADHGHYVSFQHRPVVDMPGFRLDWDYGGYCGLTVNAGSTVGHRAAFYADNPSGAGTVEINYGLFYIRNQTKGTVKNYAGYIENSDAPLYCGAPIQLDHLLMIDQAAPFIIGGPTTIGYPYAGYNYNPRTGKYVAADVAVVQYFDVNGFTVLTAAAGAAGATCTLTPRFQVKLTGQIRLVPLSADPTGAAGDLYYNGTTNKHRGHNGTSWVDLY